MEGENQSDDFSKLIVDSLTAENTSETQNSEEISEKEEVINNEVETKDNNLESNSEKETIQDQKTEEDNSEKKTTQLEQDSDPLKEFSSIQEEFKTPKELYSAYQALLSENQELKNKEPENPFANDQIKELNELAKRGARIDSKFLDEIGQNWAEMDTSNVENSLKMIRAKMKLDHPNYDEDRIEYEMDKYSFDVEDERSRLELKYDDEEVVEQKLKEWVSKKERTLKYAAEDSKEDLIKHQESLKSQGLTREEAALKAKEEQDVAIRNFGNHVNNITKDLNSIKIELEDGEVEVELGIELQKTIRQEVKKAANPETHQEFWASRGGYAEGLIQMVTRDLAFKKIVNKIAEDQRVKGEYEAVKKEKNHTPLSAKKASDDRGSSESKRIVEVMSQQINN